MCEFNDCISNAAAGESSAHAVFFRSFSRPERSDPIAVARLIKHLCKDGSRGPTEVKE